MEDASRGLPRKDAGGNGSIPLPSKGIGVAVQVSLTAEIVADYSGLSVAKNKLGEIQRTVFSLADTPKKGTIRSELGKAVRAIPAGRKGVVVFEIDDSSTTVFVFAITYGGADWISKFEDHKGH